MATVNLGRIKPVFRGAYSGSTAYVVDDIVTHGNESFICIQAHGAGTQATSQTAYWTKLAAKGADGTDVGTTLTTQGDILYRDGSGLQRLAKGTASQELRMNSGATAPEWYTPAVATSDFVKIIDQDISSTVTSINVTSWIDNSTYQSYLIKFHRITMSGANDKWKFSFINDSGTALNTGSDYSWVVHHIYMQSDNSAGNNLHESSGTSGWQFGSNDIGTSYHNNCEIMVSALDLNTAANTSVMVRQVRREQGGQQDYYTGFGWFKNSTAFTNSSAGFRLDRQGSGSFSGGNISVYGIK